MFGLSLWDGLMVAGYFLLVTVVGWKFGKISKSTEEFMVGGRSVPAWAIVLSILSTEISASTFLAVPGAAFAGDLGYLQFGLGSIVARFCIAGLFIGLYYQYNCYSVYQFLAHRFGRKTHFCTALLFIVTRIFASGVRLLIAGNGLAIFFGIPLGMTVIVFSFTAVLYTFTGGIKAVIATDIVQSLVFVGSILAVLLFLQTTAGWENLWPLAESSGHLQVFHWLPQNQPWWNDSQIFYLAFVNGLVMTIAALGIDQELAQRMLTCQTASKAKWSVIASGLVGIPITALFLFAGVGLFGYFQIFPDPHLPASADDIFPYFITRHLPDGLRGLLLIGIIAAASLSATLGSLSSSVVMDLYKPFVRPGRATEQEADHRYLTASRLLVVVFAVLLSAVAMGFQGVEGFLWWSFKAGSVTYGAMLGIFLVGVLTKNRGRDGWNLAAMGISVSVCLLLLIAMERQWVDLAWTWLILIGTGLSFGVAALPKNEQSV